MSEYSKVILCTKETCYKATSEKLCCVKCPEGILIFQCYSVPAADNAKVRTGMKCEMKYWH